VVVIINISSRDPEDDDSMDTTPEVELSVGKMGILDVKICSVEVVAEECCAKPFAVGKVLIVSSDVEASGASGPFFFGSLYPACPGRPRTPPAAEFG